MVPLVVTSAFATAAAPEASLDVRDRNVMAGSPQVEFDFTITNPNSASLLDENESVNTIWIVAPTDIVRVLTNAKPPAGWTADVVAEAGSVFFEGGPLEAGETEKFTVVASVLRPAGETASTWDVATSDDQGENFTPTSSPATELTTNVEVLNIRSIAVTNPTKATDNSVTEGQQAEVSVVIENASSVQHEVTTTLAGTGTSTATSGSETELIAPKSATDSGEATFTFDPVTFGGSGAVTLSALAESSDGVSRTGSSPELLVGVLRKVDLSYAGGLQPRFVNPVLGQAQTFQAAVENSGGVSLSDLDATLSFGPNREFFTSLDTTKTPGSIASGGTETLVFQPKFVSASALADGDYEVTLSICGKDENGMPLCLTDPATGAPIRVELGTGSDKVTLDRAAPAASPTLSVDASSIPGTTGAAADGETVTFGGTIKDTTPLGQSVDCGTCKVEAAFLSQSADDPNLALPRIPVTVTNAAGSLAGTYSGSEYDRAATSIKLHVIVSDATGNVARDASGTPVATESAAIDVDNQAPHLVNAVTGKTGGPESAYFIDVKFNEAIDTLAREKTENDDFGAYAADWVVDSNVVTEARLLTGPEFRRKVVRLSLSDPLGAEDTPTVTYQSSDLTRAYDRMGYEIDTAPPSGTPMLRAEDGILPPKPEMRSVCGRGRQEGKFYINCQLPVFVIGDVTPGHTIVIEETSAGQPTEIAPRTVAQAQEITVSSSTSYTTNGAREIRVYALEETRNRDADAPGQGPAANETLEFDFVNPTLKLNADGKPAAAVTTAGDTAILAFSEALASGRDAAKYWTVRLADQTGVITKSVLKGPSDDIRNLVTNKMFNASILLGTVRYDGPAGDLRYSDRAGNILGDFCYDHVTKAFCVPPPTT